MRTVILILYPIFCWGVFATYGLDAIQRELYLVIIVVALGLAGMSQNYWKANFSGKSTYLKSELASFCLGLLAAIVYPLVVAWHFMVRI